MSSHADTIRTALTDHIALALSDVYEARVAFDALLAENERLRAALERIATERRPDGTYNLSREACEQIAREAVRAAGE